MIILTVVKNKKVKVFKFDTITESYRYYVKHYATISDWFYYFTCCGVLLNKVIDEEIMECIFRNVFKKGCICKKDG